MIINSSIKNLIKTEAVSLGFLLVGITSAKPVDGVEHLLTAIDKGLIADMKWLARNPEARMDPSSLLPGARSVICFALEYGEYGINGRNRSNNVLRARYARGEDYHKVITEKLKLIWEKISEKCPNSKAKICVDTSPIMEKTLAARAGLGWIGKHTILINGKMGSYFALGEIITDIELEPDTAAKDSCGKCNLCVKACPTGALQSPYKLDSRKCVSYLTTAHKSEIPDDMKFFIKEGRLGCDACQEACPYNSP